MYLTNEQLLAENECLSNIEILREWKKSNFKSLPPTNISTKALSFYQLFSEHIEEVIEAQQEGKVLY
jgi:hypothetical protein